LILRIILFEYFNLLIKTLALGNIDFMPINNLLYDFIKKENKNLCFEHMFIIFVPIIKYKKAGGNYATRRQKRTNGTRSHDRKSTGILCGK
jgi:hypothetical protein